jgi:hypothetical protein
MTNSVFACHCSANRPIEFGQIPSELSFFASVFALQQRVAVWDPPKVVDSKGRD